MQQQKTPVGARKRKRRRLKDCDLSDLLSPDSPLFQSKRRSKDTLSNSTSFLDYSLVSPATPNGLTPGGPLTPNTPATPIPPPKPVTARHQVATELLQTEKNYVDILTTILKVWYFYSTLLINCMQGLPRLIHRIRSFYGNLLSILEASKTNDIYYKVLGYYFLIHWLHFEEIFKKCSY